MAMVGSVGSGLDAMAISMINIKNTTAVPTAAAAPTSDVVLNAEAFEIKEPENNSSPATSPPESDIVAAFARHLAERADHHLGYPYNLDFDYAAAAPLLRFAVNNLGDPFVESNYGVHSRPFELAVLDWFARLWDLGRDEYWGYVTNCGTEGNLHGILLGRELFPDGVLYASRDSHYSVFKAARMYRMDCVVVDSLVSGAVSCGDLELKLLANTDRPAILNVNIGTTVKGAVDDLDEAISVLLRSGFAGRFYIHCDGALAGLMLPFMKDAPVVTFKKPIGSVSVSGHKFLGSPVPCGVVMTRREHVGAVASGVEYLASRDATIMGSRSGHAPVFLWCALRKKGRRGLRKDVQRCLRGAHYLLGRLLDAGVGARLNPLSTTVVFERPPDEAFVRRWQLACQGSIAHVVVMPNVTVERIDQFVAELVDVRAAGAGAATRCVAPDIGQESCLCTLHKKPRTI